ncbi:MAG: AIM24 family protein [Oscillospiraceae bacterium]|nr:AIM24 family protein [Oscillospiraceae bacterium]
MNQSAVGTRENIKIIDTSVNKNMKIEILEYQKLLGGKNPYSAEMMYYMEKQNMKVRQAAIYLTNDTVKVEPGAMSYFKGNLEMVSGVTPGNLLGRMFTGAVTGEAAAQPEYRGTGMVVLEPTFKHLLTLELQAGEEIIVDKGMFFAAQGSANVSAYMQRNLSSAALGGEGIFQTSIKGPGLVILECAVPMCEIDIIDLENDTLKVDGNFAVLRTGGIDFTVERSAKTLIGSAVSGEGLVNVYRGTGQVWLAPTIKVYESMLSSPYSTVTSASAT